MRGHLAIVLSLSNSSTFGTIRGDMIPLEDYSICRFEIFFLFPNDLSSLVRPLVSFKINHIRVWWMNLGPRLREDS